MAVDLPHRSPFVLLDEVLERVAGERAVARRVVPSMDPLVRDASCLSEIFLVEAMAQCAGIAAARRADETAGVLVAVDGFRAPTRVVLGDVMLIEARVLKRMGMMARARATVHVGKDLCAEAELTLRLGPAPSRSA